VIDVLAVEQSLVLLWRPVDSVEVEDRFIVPRVFLGYPCPAPCVMVEERLLLIPVSVAKARELCM